MSDLAGDVAIIDGELYPLSHFDFSIEANIDRVNGIGSFKSQTIQTGQQVSGSFESFRDIDQGVVQLGSPERHTIYFFSEEEGMKRRYTFDDVIFKPTPPDNTSTQTTDFVAESYAVD